MPNRGVDDSRTVQTDQFVVTLDYEQVIHQVAVEAGLESGRRSAGIAIHHEPGLFLNLTNEIPDGFDVAASARSRTVTQCWRSATVRS